MEKVEIVYSSIWDFLERNKGVIKGYVARIPRQAEKVGFENYLVEKCNRIWNTTRKLNGFVITNAFNHYFNQAKFSKINIYEELEGANMGNMEGNSYEMKTKDIEQTSVIDGILYRYQKETNDLKTIGTIKALIKKYPAWDIQNTKDRNSWNYCMNKIKEVIKC